MAPFPKVKQIKGALPKIEKAVCKIQAVHTKA